MACVVPYILRGKKRKDNHVQNKLTVRHTRSLFVSHDASFYSNESKKYALWMIALISDNNKVHDAYIRRR